MIDLKSGFYNSVDGDRTYNADDMNMPYSRIISNGVMAGDDFQVVANDNLTVTVKKGFGLFDKNWAELENDAIINIPTPNVLNKRIDSVIIRNDKTNERKCVIDYIQGEASSNPTAPTLSNGEYRLANITIVANATSIDQSMIDDFRPTAECGFIHNLLWTSDITSLYESWKTQFIKWFDNLKETLVSATAMVSFSNEYTTTQQNETVIPIGIKRFNSVTDILQVYINGLICIPEIDYTIDIANFENITLKNGVDKDTLISFIVYKSVDGSQAESVVSQLNELYEDFEVVKAQSSSANSKIVAVNDSISNLNTKVAKNITDIAGLATSVNKLEGVTYSPLWEGAKTMGASDVITPSKKLDECRNGWLLVWSGYNTSTGKATQTRLQFTYVPKNVMANLTVESMPIYSNLLYTYYESGNFDTTAKLVTVTDTKITGFAGNTVTDFGKGICLMYVMEW